MRLLPPINCGAVQRPWHPKITLLEIHPDRHRINATWAEMTSSHHQVRSVKFHRERNKN